MNRRLTYFPCRVPVLFALLAGLALGFSGCSRERMADQAKAQGLLLMGNGPEPQALDPHVTTGNAELTIQMALYEGLFSPHPETLEPLPAVAESWTRSDDGKTYRFKLRPAARWSDGAPVRSADFVAAWKRALDPEQGTPYAYMLYPLKGAEPYNRGEGISFEAVGVKEIDEHELEVTLERPIPYFLSLLMHPVWYPVPSHAISQGGKSERIGAWTKVETFIGNGPFRLREWRPTQYVEVEKNQDYWDAGMVQLKAIRFMALDEPGAEERAFMAGQLHVTDALPPARVAAYRKTNSPLLQIDPYLGTYYLLPNVRSGVLADSRVRQALSLTINREILVANLLGAGQKPAAGFVPDAMPGYESPVELVYDPEQGRALLAEAGYPNGKGFPVLEYLYNSSESHRMIAEALQAMWQKELGISIQLANQEWRTYLQRRATGDFQLARAVWIGDYPEPSTFLDLWKSGSGNNWAGWSNASYDALLESAHATLDPDQRMAFYRQAESLLIEDQAIIPLYQYVTVYLKVPELKGWTGNLLDWHPVKYLSFD